MGTPDFAVEPLKKLVYSGYKIAAVVTVADKPAGRGLKLHSSPVKQFALSHNIDVLQPVKLKDPEFLNALRAYNADLFIVVAFRKLPAEVWQMPPLGCFNLHASLLPQYRGAAPVNHAVINGESKTGVTTFFLNEAIDEGKIILQKEITIDKNETAGEVHDRLMYVGADLVVETVKAICEGNGTAIDQQLMHNDDKLKTAPKIFREDCRINWNAPAISVHNFIRGLSPYPAAFNSWQADNQLNDIKLLKSSLTGQISSHQPGVVLIQNEKMYVSAIDKLIEITEVQPSGKKAMLVSEFLRGNRSKFEKLL